jgi:hypothetical protein
MRRIAVLISFAALIVWLLPADAFARGGGRGGGGGGFHSGGGLRGGGVSGFRGGVFRGGSHFGAMRLHNRRFGHIGRRFAHHRSFNRLSFALWPYAYHNLFWKYDIESILAIIYGLGPYPVAGSIYDIYGDQAYSYRYKSGSGISEEATIPTNDDSVQACEGLAPGVADFLDGIEEVIHPTSIQVTGLTNLRSASLRAIEVLKVSCASEVPLTPARGLDVVEKRLDALIQAMQIVREPLDTFYESLSDNQRRRFDVMAMTNLIEP